MLGNSLPSSSQECIQYISDWYFSDTIELLDLVLDDDISNPQYSAITTLNRIWIYIQYRKRANQDYEYNDVFSLLKKSGYTTKDIDLFRKKVQEERKIYTGDILDTEFLRGMK